MRRKNQHPTKRDGLTNAYITVIVKIYSKTVRAEGKKLMEAPIQ